VDGNLVRRQNSRFTLLETIREYAQERLGAANETGEYRRRHAHHYLAVAERAWADILEGPEEEGFALLDLEQENLYAALAWAVENADADVETRLAAAQRWYWLVRGRLNEGARVFEHAVEATSELPAARAGALAGAGTFNVRRGDRKRGAAQLQAALELFRSLGDEGEMSRCIAELGHVAVDDGDLDRAAALYTEAIEVFERVGNVTRHAVALANLAAIAAQRGDGPTAAAYGERAIELQRANGDLDGMAVSLANLGRVRLALDDDAGARAALRESFELGLRLDYRMLLAYLLGAAAELARRAGAQEESARLLGAGAALFEAIGMAMPQEEIDEHEQTLVPLREGLGDDATARLVAEGGRAQADEMIERAREFTL
jgi:tetratricopeptide (TPR) repeat protein